MRILHGHRDVPMAKNALKRENISTVHHVVTGEGMPEDVGELLGGLPPIKWTRPIS